MIRPNLREKFNKRYIFQNRRVKAGTPGAIQKEEFVGYVVKVGGIEHYLGKDKKIAEAKAFALVNEYLLNKRDVPFESVGYSPELNHAIDRYRESLTAREKSEKHISEACGRLIAVVDDLGWKKVSNATLAGLDSWLNAKRKADKPGTKVRFSVRTANKYRETWRAFGRWLEKLKIVRESPFRHIELVNKNIGRVKLRRTFSESEQDFLIKSVGAFQERGGMTSEERRLLYAIAVLTGLRVKEISQLKREMFSVAPGYRYEIPPGLTKNRQSAVIHMGKPLGDALNEVYKKLRPGGLFFPALAKGPKIARILREDVADARRLHPCPPPGFLEERTPGEIDFHSFRKSMINDARVHSTDPGVLQKVARHSEIKTTLESYGEVKEPELIRVTMKLSQKSYSWFSDGSPKNQKISEHGQTKVNKALRVLEKFISSINPYEIKEFREKAAGLLGLNLEGRQ